MFVYAALLHIEKSGLVELSGRSAVCGLDIIGVDLELGLCAHLGVVRKEQVPVGLMGFSMLCIGRYLKVADEASACVVIKDELDELVGRTASDGMRDVRLGSDGFIAMQVLQAINLRQAAFS